MYTCLRCRICKTGEIICTVCIIIIYKGIFRHVQQRLAAGQNVAKFKSLVLLWIGENLHEAPEVPNFGRRGNGIRLKEGLVIAIEPMVNMGTRKVKWDSDGWTVVSADGLPSAHYEHTVAVCENKTEILSSFEWIEAELSIQ